MTHLLIDTSVLIKWFHSEGESEVEASRALRSAHLRGDVEAHILDLATYEIGNVLIRSLRWRSADTADQLDDVNEILGPPLVMTPTALRDAASLAEVHTLSFYDASWAAAARDVGIVLVSAHRRLLSSGLAESPTQITARLHLPLP